MKNWFWGQMRESRWWLSMRCWLKKGEQGAVQEGTELWLHSQSRKFTLTRAHSSVLLRTWFTVTVTVFPHLFFDYIMKTMGAQDSAELNDFNRIWLCRSWDDGKTWTQAAHYLYVDVVLAVLDGVDVSIEDWVLTGSSRPTISRAQHLTKEYNYGTLFNIQDFKWENSLQFFF